MSKQLQWQEPKGFRKSDLKAAQKSVRRIIFLTMFTALLFIVISSWLDVDLRAEMTWKLLIAAGGIVIICLLIFFGYYFIPFRVKITDKSIVVEDVGETPTIYKFKDIAHCEAGHMQIGSKTHLVLIIELKNGDREIIGVAPSISPDVLRQTLEQSAVKVMIRPDMLGEAVLENENREPY